MLIGFGCSVPAIMATRTLTSERDRKMTIILTPVHVLQRQAADLCGCLPPPFSHSMRPLVMIGLYVIGMLVAILCGLALEEDRCSRATRCPLSWSCRPTGMPDARKSVLMHMWEKAKDFLHRAFTIIFVATIIIWFLQSL